MKAACYFYAKKGDTKMGLLDNVKIFYTMKAALVAARDGRFRLDVSDAIKLFKAQDWGIVSAADKECNDEAVTNFDMLLGAYETTTQGRLWLIAESSTGREYDRLTVLFPDEY